MKGMMVGVIATVMALCSGCAALSNPQVPVDAVLTAEMAFCISQKYQEPILQLMVDCKIPDTLLQDAAALQASTSSAAASAAKAGKAGAHKPAAHSCK